jgi:hypothetical protein
MANNKSSKPIAQKPKKKQHPNSLANLTKGKKDWVKGQSGNPKGKPPILMTSILKELKASGYERVGAATVVEAFENLMGLPEQKLKELLLDENNPMSVRIIIKAMLSAKGWDVLQAMFDRAHGKSLQHVDLTTAGVPLANTKHTVTFIDGTGERIEIEK